MDRVGKFTVEAFKTVALTLGFAAFVHTGSMLAPEALSVRPIVWFGGAGGIGLLLIFGARYWPTIGLGWLLSYHFRSDLPFLTHCLMAATIALSCWTVVKFLHTQKFDRSLSTPRDLVLLGMAVVMGALLNVIALSPILGVYADWGRFSQWLLSYVAGAVMVLPVTLSWLYGGSFGSAKRWAHLGVCLAVGILTIWVSQRYSTAASGFHTFHYLPLMVWASLAFNVRGATAIMSIIHTFAYWSLIDLTGPVLIDQTNHSLGIAATQQYIILSGFTVLVLAALVDHRKEAARLTDREQRLTGVVETAEDGILVVDEDGIIDDMNPAALRMFGFDDLAETRGYKTEEIFVGDRALLGTHVKSARRKDGTEFPAQITVGKPWSNKDGRKYTTKIVRDITKQRRAEAELLDREERYRAIVETAADGIIVVNAKGIIQSFNHAAEAMFGYESGDAIGYPVGMLLPDQAPHQNATGTVVEALRKDGSTFPAHLAIANWEVGGERFYTAITRDLTKQKASEEARDILAREVDHRAKNALAVVQSLVKLTKANNVNDFIGAVSGRIEALARAHSLLSQTNWSGVSLLQIAEDELAATQKGEVSISGSAIRMKPDAVQPISMLFHELSTNAFKYGALRSPNGSVSLSWKVINKNLVIHWLEDGPTPITPPASFGFGSTMMKQVVTKQLQGAIDYDWRENGVCVTIVLPPCSFTKTSVAKKPKAPQDSIEPPSGKGKRVLIVEDNALIMMELEATLEENGYNVVGRANSVPSALNIIDNTEIDVAVLDVDLSGIYSFPVADALIAKKVPFAFATGFETLTTEQGYKAPALTKPVNDTTLLKTFDSLLSNSPK